MTDTEPGPSHVPSERQLALFRTLEDVHDLTQASAVLLVDGDGVAVAVSGDDEGIPASLRSVLSGKQLAAAGSVRALLENVDLAGVPINVTIFDIDGTHLLAILFDAEADLATVQEVGQKARSLLAEILSAPLDS